MSFSGVVVKDYLPDGVDMSTVEGTVKALVKVCSQITSQAKAFAPKDTGILKSSLGYKVGDIGNGKFDATPLEELGGVVGTNVEYATYQEFGTRNMAPNPFLRPAVAKYTTNQTSEQIAKKIIYEHVKGKLGNGRQRVQFFSDGVTK